MAVLPDVDKYRRPFIEPLGYLTFFAAQSENLLIGIIALLDAQPDRLDSDLASELAAASELVWPWKSADTVNNKIESRVVEPVLADGVPPRGVTDGIGRRAVRLGRVGQRAATAGRLMKGSSLNCPTLSSVM